MNRFERIHIITDPFFGERGFKWIIFLDGWAIIIKLFKLLLPNRPFVSRKKNFQFKFKVSFLVILSTVLSEQDAEKGVYNSDDGAIS